MELNISSTSVDENTGIARIIIEGTIKVPKECDDPIIELFRPIRLIVAEDMLFTVLAKTTNDSIIINLIPSNRRNRKIKEFLSVAIEVLEGSEKYPGVVREYTKLLNNYFEKANGLKRYLEIIEKDSDELLPSTIKAANDSIKMFVAEEGLTMPSFKKRSKKPAN